MLKPDSLEFEKEPPLGDNSCLNRSEPTDNTSPLNESDTSVSVADFSDQVNKPSGSINLSHCRERELYTLLENSPDIIVRYDTSLNRIYANRTYIQQTGFSEQEAVGVSLFDKNVLPETTALQFRQMLQNVFLTAAPAEKDFEWTDRYDVFHCFSVRVIPEFDPQGQLESFMAIARDITDRRKSELLLQQRENEYRVLVENSSECIVRFDKNCRIVFANRHVFSLLRCSEQKLIGKTLLELFPEFLHEIGRKEIGIYTSALEEALVLGEKREFEMNFMLPAGKFYSYKVVVLPEKDLQGNVTGLISFGRNITEYKKTENDLREAQNRLEAIISTIPDLLWLKDKNGVYLSCNKAFKEFFRATEDQIIGKTDYAFVKKEIAEFFRAKDREAIAAGKICINQEVINYADHEGILETRKVPLYNTTGELEGVLGIAREITERINADKALSESEEKFSSAFRSSPSAFAIINLKKDTILDANDSFCKLTGYDREEVIGTRASDLRVFSPSQKFLEKRRDFYRNGKIKNLEFHFLHRNGYSRWGLVSAVKINVGGQACILFQIIDITRRKRMEKKLLDEQFKLSEAQRIGKIGSWEYNFETSQVSFSREINNIYEIDPERLTTTYTKFLEWVHPDDRDFVQEAIKNSVIHHKPCIIEHRIMFPDGKIKYAFQHSEAFYDDRGNPQRMIGTIQDITFKKVAELELLQAKESAEESNRLKSAFLATMNHELRTPLNHIIGFSDIIINQPEKAPDFVEVIKSSGQKLLDIVEDIFQLALAEQSEIILRNDSFNLGCMFSDSIQVLSEILEVSGKRKVIDLLFSPEESLLNKHVIGDLNKINQVLGNLFKNAVKFTEKGFIEFGMNMKSPGSITFFVRDTGMGIPKDKHTVIFEFFRQADDSNTRKYGGIGVGLAISKRITEVLKGKLTFISEPHQGSTFYFSIPVEEE